MKTTSRIVTGLLALLFLVSGARWIVDPTGAAAVMRTLAWAAGHADLATPFIVFEIIMAAILVGAARLRAGEGG